MRAPVVFVAISALLLVVLLGPQLVRRFRVPARRRVPVRGGVLVMHAPARYGIALGISALIPAAVLGAIAVRLFLGGREGTFGLVEIVLATLAALGVAVHQFVSAFRRGFVVDEFGLTSVAVLGKRRIRWGEITKFAYNPVNQWFFLTVADGSHMWVPVETHGIADFAGIALLRLPPAALKADDLAREALEELAAAQPAA
ncbi:MAG TPA: PH domain-containing protein [Anaeromyxobacter sp.]|nr:PH domain-containing protein [Anaeromyxobacter sp.]